VDSDKGAGGIGEDGEIADLDTTRGSLDVRMIDKTFGLRRKSVL
jgi:hypothetical protein